jgi:hypothetical protein
MFPQKQSQIVHLVHFLVSGREQEGLNEERRQEKEYERTMLPGGTVGLVHDVDRLRTIVKFISRESWPNISTRCRRT